MRRRQPHSRSRVVRALSPLRDFLAAESAGAAFLAIAAVVALIWANSPWSTAYTDLWHTEVAVRAGSHQLTLDLRHFVDEALMTVFFLVVGLEIKRELTDGHLSTRRAAVLPAVAALGGMLLPALFYLAVAGGSAPRGWAIPLATDIALAVGVLTVVGDRIPPALRAFLLGLAIVDDIGAIVVIAVAYSQDLHLAWLLAGAGAAVAALLVDRLGVWSPWVFAVLLAVMWLGCYQAGLHPTIAGVAMGLLAPSTPRLSAELIDVEALADLSDAAAARQSVGIARDSVSVVEWMQHVLHPWSSKVIVPVFALANAGIVISADGLHDAVRSPIAWGVLLGLVLGKPIGIVAASRGAKRLDIADLPTDTSTRQLIGVGTAAGIGFTVALFVTELAFTAETDRTNAKIAILVASAIAAIVALVVLLTTPRPRPARSSD